MSIAVGVSGREMAIAVFGLSVCQEIDALQLLASG